MENVPAQPASPPKSQIFELVVTVLIPGAILSKLSAEDWLGPVNALILAVSIPLAYAIWDFIKVRRLSFIAVLGFCNVLLTGGLGLAKVDGIWFAVKEASVPSVLGFVLLWTARSENPLVKTFLYNDKFLNIPAVESALEERKNKIQFNKLLSVTTLFLACSFFLSGLLNFILAILILKSPSGTVQFNEELGKMNILSYPVIVLPNIIMMMFALWYLTSGLKKLTGLELQGILKQENL